MNQDSMFLVGIIMAVVGGVAGLVRRNRNNINYWIATAATVFVAVNLLWILYFVFKTAAILTAVALAMGWFSQELHHALATFLSRPRNIAWLVGIVIFVVLLFHKELWAPIWQLAVLVGVLFFFYRFIIRGSRRRGNN